MALSKARMDERRAKGLCFQCGDPANGKSRCEPCAEKDKAAKKKRAENLKKEGKCVVCSKQTASGYATCADCIAKTTKVATARYYKNKNDGVCRRCGNPTVENASRCDPCAKLFRESQNKRNAAKVAEKICIWCPKPARPGRTACEDCAQKQNARSKAAHADRKLKVLQHYSKGKMACKSCGFDKNPASLQIDHIAGGGTKHLREIGHGQLYPWLIENNFPEGFQVLCANCNFAKGNKPEVNRPLLEKEDSDGLPGASAAGAAVERVQPGVLREAESRLEHSSSDGGGAASAA